MSRLQVAAEAPCDIVSNLVSLVTFKFDRGLLGIFGGVPRSVSGQFPGCLTRWGRRVDPVALPIWPSADWSGLVRTPICVDAAPASDPGLLFWLTRSRRNNSRSTRSASPIQDGIRWTGFLPRCI